MYIEESKKENFRSNIYKHDQKKKKGGGEGRINFCEMFLAPWRKSSIRMIDYLMWKKNRNVENYY